MSMLIHFLIEHDEPDHKGIATPICCSSDIDEMERLLRRDPQSYIIVSRIVDPYGTDKETI